MNKRNILLSGAAALAFINPTQTFAQYNSSAVAVTQASQQVMNALTAANALAAAQGSSGTQPAAQALPTATPLLGPKKPGTVRIGIILPQAAQGTAGPSNAREELRNEWMQLFTGPNLEPVKITPDCRNKGSRKPKLLTATTLFFRL